MKRRAQFAVLALALALVLPAGALAAAPPASQPIQLVLPLSADLAGLQSVAQAVSTPGSPEYGQYEPIATLEQRFGASPSTRRRVIAYLQRAGASSVRVDATGLFAVATMRAGLAEQLFATPLKTVRAASGARFVAPAGTARVPGSLHGLVTGVVGLDTQSLASPPPRVVHGALAHSAQASGQQTSAYASATGTAAGCAKGRALGAFTPNQYLTAYHLEQLHDESIRGRESGSR